MALFQTDHVWLGQSEGDALLHLDFPEDPTNRLTPTAVLHLHEALAHVESSSFRRLFLRSAKSGHFAQGPTPDDWRQMAESGRVRQFLDSLIELGQRLRSLPIPVVALVSGRCLGAGLSLALACDYRVGLASPKVQFGFPEIGIGIIPIGGATQQLPRIIGLERAVHMVLFGQRVGVTRAHRWGLVDAVVESTDLAVSAVGTGMRKVMRSSLPLHTWRQRLIEGHPIGRKLVFRVTRRFLKRNTPQDVQAPFEYLNAIEEGLRRGIPAGIDYEREAIARLLHSEAFSHLAHVLIERERIERHARSAPGCKVATVGLLGDSVLSGLMAASAALHGMKTILQQPDESSLSMALLALVQALEDEARKTLVDQAELRQAMARVHGSHTWRRIEEVDLAVLCATEGRPAEASLIGETLQKLRAGAILAVDIGDAPFDQSLTDPDPKRIVAIRLPRLMHISPVVEVIRRSKPSAENVATLMRFFAELDRLPIAVDGAGQSLLQRVMGNYWQEAIRLVAEGFRVDEIDRTMRQFGMREGPLEFLDRIGLDSAQKLLPSAPASATVFEPDLRLLCDKGWLGRKCGKGFYRWGWLRRKPNHLARNTLVLAYRDAGGTPVRIAAPSARTNMIRNRLVGISINEAVRCLGDGLIEDWQTLDVAIVLGGHWAPHRGGPIHYARSMGYDRTLALLDELAETFGERFRPAPHWSELVEKHSTPASLKNENE